jgi:hypothetical protein
MQEELMGALRQAQDERDIGAVHAAPVERGTESSQAAFFLQGGNPFPYPPGSASCSVRHLEIPTWSRGTVLVTSLP